LSSGNLTFTLDADTQVASASESLTSEGNVLTVTGKKKANVTAAAIGPESNIAKDTKLKIEDFSQTTYFAVANNAFVGGTKQTIQTVAKDDRDNLVDSVTKKIEAQEKTLIAQKMGSLKLLDNLTTIDLKEENFSKELGEEAKEVSLSAKGTIIFYTYDDNDMKTRILQNVKDSITSGYVAGPANISYTDLNATSSAKGITVTLNSTITPHKNLDKSQVLKTIIGKSQDDIDRLMRLTYQVEEYKMTIHSLIPIINKRVPFFSRNIKLNIDTTH
jgi:hypothetical protein